MATATTKTTLESEARALALVEVLVETNSGTYSGVEACRTCGCGDPHFADYRIYERVGDGFRRREGCSEDRAPGAGGASARTSWPITVSG